MSTVLLIFVAATIGTAISLTATPLLIYLAHRNRWLDTPNHRKVHKADIPRLGGVAIAGACAAALLSVFLLVTAFGGTSLSAALLSLEHVGARRALVGAALLMGLLGLLDDLFSLNAKQKLFVQVIVATLLYSLGFAIQEIRISSDLIINLGIYALPTTILWIVGLVNAFNFIDGLDGLAAGVGMIGALAIAVISFMNGHIVVAVASAALFGSLLGFFPYNFHPARIFMGDCGSYFAGTLLAGEAVIGGKQGNALDLWPMLMVMGLPVLDTAFAIVRRFFRGQSIYRADRRHAHHRLIDLGYNQVQSVAILWTTVAMLALAAIVMTLWPALLVPLTLAMGAAALFGAKFLWQPKGFHEDRRGRMSYLGNTFLRGIPSRLRKVRDRAGLEGFLSEVAKALDFDWIQLRVHAAKSRVEHGVPRTVEIGIFSGSLNVNSLRDDLKGFWIKEMKLSRGKAWYGQLSVGRPLGRRRRREEDDVEWAEELAECLTLWLSRNRSRIDFEFVPGAPLDQIRRPDGPVWGSA